MKSQSVAALVVAVATMTCSAGPPPDALVEKLTAAIREHCPDAEIAVTNGLFTAKYGTMMFTIHPRLMTGEVLAKTRQEEGPNFKGFVLTVGVEDGPYRGQPMIPQELHGPYYPTFVNGPPTDDGANHYWITFSYGTRLDPLLKQAILDALPKGNFQPGGKANGSRPIR